MKKLSILLVLAIFCLSTTSTFAQDTKEVAKKEMKAKKKIMQKQLLQTFQKLFKQR